MSSGFILPLVSRLSILDKNSLVIPFRPNWAQEIYFAGIEEDLRANKPSRNIVLKARQLGISTATEAYIYGMSFLLRNSRSLVIADDVENSQHLLSITDTYWETDPLNVLYRTKYQAKNTLAWHETNSSIRTSTAGNKRAGRSRTLRNLHASEVAFWPEPKTVMTGLLQALPSLPLTFLTLESTANGRGNYFHDTWKQAITGENEYRPYFFPFWMHNEYRASWIGLPRPPVTQYDEEERHLLALFKNGLTVGPVTYTIPSTEWDDALAWRRWAIRNQTQNDLWKFHQEYPSTPEEAFVATGLNVFPSLHLAECFKPEPGRRGRLVRNGSTVAFKEDVTGPLTLYRKPHPDLEWGVYSIGGDATATLRGDFAVAQVINRRTFEQVAVWRGRIDPIHFGEELAKLGIFYNSALLAPENEGPGYATVGSLMQLDYPNMFQMTLEDNLPGRFTGKYGWSSSYKTKGDAISWVLRLVIDHTVVIHDRPTYDEMDNYVTLEGGEYGPGDGTEHDDTVMALAIGITSSILQGPMPAYGDAFTGQVSPQVEEAPWEAWGEVNEYEGV